MAGNKVNTKTKGKDEKGKTNKQTIGQPNEDSEEPDFAVLRKPIPTSITGFAQARKIFDMATEELKNLLSDECDILYECKVCRNIFRSLANYISHKRIYCRDKFNSLSHGHFIETSDTINEIKKIDRIEETYHESLKDPNDSEENGESVERIPLTKDLTAIMEKIARNKGVHPHNIEDHQMIFEKIPSSSVAMFQSFEKCDKKSSDHMRLQVKELENIMSRNVGVLQRDGNFEVQSSTSEMESVIQISDDEDENQRTDALKCKICDMQFSTQKTLKFHMKYKHMESRLVYPCPDCLEIFSTSWSVYRHLFKVHRKTAAQVRRLRESIQSKAFKMNNPPAFYERRKNNIKPAPTQKISEEERLDQENQAWMDNLEGDGELPRCGGCGRSFERRAALAAHTHTCPPRSRALQRRPDAKRIEIQIRRDYHKGPPALALPPRPDPTVIERSKEEVRTTSESPPITSQSAEGSGDRRPADDPNGASSTTDTPMDTAEAEQSQSTETDETHNENASNKPTPHLQKIVSRLPYSRQAEKSNLLALRKKILPNVDVETLVCKKCDTRCDSLPELYDHAAEHHGWMRYACKLCNFKHYYFEKLPEHVKVVHKLKGDKDFYFSTVKALDGPEAMELSSTNNVESTDENETNDGSPDSRRPSRCSSDSSRVSDDSSSSSTRFEIGTRKRKMYHSKALTKRRKASPLKCEDHQIDEVAPNKEVSDVDSSSNVKTFEENSSDIDEIDEKLVKRQVIEDTSSVASRRPVRRKTKLKNEDFEYDLSNLLKMEAQGYRDSLTVTNTKSNQIKKKLQQDTFSSFYYGALVALSKKSVENASAHMKTPNFNSTSSKDTNATIFVRPMIPKSISRGDKISPKKDVSEDRKDSSSPNKEPKTTNILDAEECSTTEKNKAEVASKEKNEMTGSKDELNSKCDLVKKNINIPAVVPLKLRRQSMEVIKNPLINKNITDFTKAGMKTKILVIKPINRKKDGTQSINSPLKFQTIKLKDPNKRSITSDTLSDQVVVVKVPKVVDCTIARHKPELNSVNGEKVSTDPNINNSENKESTETQDCNIVDRNVTEKPVEIKTETEVKDPAISENEVTEKNDPINIEAISSDKADVRENKEPIKYNNVEALTSVV